MIRLIITPASTPGSFMASLDGQCGAADRAVIVTSRQPLADGARKLLAMGYDPGTTLTMRHAGKAYDSFQLLPIGEWAKVAFKEPDRGRLHRVKWEPRPDAVSCSPGGPKIRILREPLPNSQLRGKPIVYGPRIRPGSIAHDHRGRHHPRPRMPTFGRDLDPARRPEGSKEGIPEFGTTKGLVGLTEPADPACPITLAPGLATGTANARESIVGVPQSAIITVLTAQERTGKAYSLRDGALQESSVATARGRAIGVPIGSAQDLGNLLAEVASDPSKVLVPGHFIGNDDERPFEVVYEAELAELLGKSAGDTALAGVHEVDGRRIAARLKRSIEPCRWMLLDFDSPEGMPPELAGLDIAGRLALLEKIIPGISTCERVECRSSSARVVKPGGKPRPRRRGFVGIQRRQKQ